MKSLFLFLFQYRQQHPLAYRLLFYIILFSSFFTLLSTGVQLFQDYRQGVHLIQHQLKEIEESYLQGVTQSIWFMDSGQTKTLLAGILQLQDVQHVEFIEEDLYEEKVKESNRRYGHRSIIRIFPLQYKIENEEYNLGFLYVVASLEGIYTRLQEKVLVILITQAIKTFIVSLFILFIVQFLLTRHLETMANYTAKLNIERLESPLNLNRTASKVNADKPDELERVVVAINQMRLKMRHDILKRKQAESMIQELNEGLERKVAERTEELNQKNRKLQETLQELKETQDYLVQNEKIAALGKLVANIAHEVNTPLSAMRSSTDNLLYLLDKTLKNFPHFFCDLPEKRKEDYMTIINRSLEHEDHITLKEERQISKKLRAELKELFADRAWDLADDFVQMRIYDQLERFHPLLQSSEGENVLQMARQMVSQLHSAQAIKMATDRMSKVIFALKAFSNLEASQGEMSSISVIENIEIVLTLYQNQFKMGVDLQRKYADLPMIDCYADELNHVWTNLIHNALYAMDHKGVLTIETAISNNHIRVSITDSGSGIPFEIQPKIFDPFFTTKGSGEGCGLGLDICRRVVHKHQGTITFCSEPGETTFTVILPVNKTGHKQKASS